MTDSDDRQLCSLLSLDGLRALAVVLTSLVHIVPELVPGGFLGVDVFFVLSGFLITSILLGEFGRTGRIALGSLHVRRARRLLPAVLALIAVFTVVVVVSSPDRRDLVVAGAVDLGVLTYTFNVGPLLGHNPPWQVDHLWSLSVEEQFYLLWPVLLVLLLKVAGRRTIMILTAAGALASTVGQALIFALTHSVAWGYVASPFHANGILLGCLLAQLYVWRKAEGQFHWIATKAWPLVVSLVVLLMLSLVLDVNDLSTYAGGILLGAMAAGVLVAGMVGRDTFGLTASWLSRVFRSRPLVAIGERSYSIYLWENFVCLGTVRFAPRHLVVGTRECRCHFDLCRDLLSLHRASICPPSTAHAWEAFGRCSPAGWRGESRVTVTFRGTVRYLCPNG